MTNDPRKCPKTSQQEQREKKKPKNPCGNHYLGKKKKRKLKLNGKINDIVHNNKTKTNKAEKKKI